MPTKIFASWFTVCRETDWLQWHRVWRFFSIYRRQKDIFETSQRNYFNVRERGELEAIAYIAVLLQLLSICSSDFTNYRDSDNLDGVGEGLCLHTGWD